MHFTDSEENEFLDSTIVRVDDEIRALLSKKAFLRRRANALRERTRLLPPEVLTAIFEHAIHENRHPIPGIASVCYRWRKVLWTSPTLWTSIRLASGQSGVWNLLDLHRQNAKDVSLSIQFLTHHGFKAPLSTLLELLRVVMTDCTTKTQSLQLGPLDKTVWEFVAPYATLADFPRLHSLRLNFKSSFRTAFEGTTFCRTPKLRTIELKEPLPGIEFQLPFHQLTTLVLNKPSPVHALYILAQCPNLVEFRSEDTSPPTPESLNFALAEPVMLTKLESLFWDSGSILLGATFISEIHLPSIRQLSWLSALDPATNHVWKPLFSTMSRVQVLDCKYSAGLLDLLATLPSLERVHIKFESFFDYLWEITNFLTHLIWRERSRTLLPHLVELSITLEDKHKVVSKDKLRFHDVLVEGLESRGQARDSASCSLQRFSLTLAVLGVWGSWQKCLVHDLKRLGQQDLDVKIVQL